MLDKDQGTYNLLIGRKIIEKLNKILLDPREATIRADIECMSIKTTCCKL